MELDICGDDIRKQMLHIKKNLQRGRKSVLYIEIYDDSVLLVYRDIELPVKIMNVTGKQHNLKEKYAISDYSLLQKAVMRFKDCEFYKFIFYPNCISIVVDKLQLNIAAKICD